MSVATINIQIALRHIEAIACEKLAIPEMDIGIAGIPLIHLRKKRRD
jgi:hypothetical protein